MTIDFIENTNFDEEDKRDVEDIINYYQESFAFNKIDEILVNMTYEMASKKAGCFAILNGWNPYSVPEMKEGLYEFIVYEDSIDRTINEVADHLSNFQIEKKDLKDYICMYLLAREVYAWLLIKEEGIELFEAGKRNEEKQRLLAAMQRFFAISYFEKRYGSEVRIKFLRLLNMSFEYKAPISMFVSGDKLFEASISTVAGKRVMPKDMGIYKSIFESFKTGAYSKGIEELIRYTSMANKRYISVEEYEAYKELYYPAVLMRRTDDNNDEVAISELEKNALLFIWEDCKMFKHTYPGKYVVDDGLLCMYHAIHEFMETGSKYDAIDIYNCYCRRFLKGDKMQEFINMISSYENNASRLVQSHRDHYSHSAYVFILGMAIYHTNNNFRNVFKERHYASYKMKDLDKENVVNGLLNVDYIDLYCGNESEMLYFLRIWGLTALFHDIGYQFEIPFEQIKNTSGEKIIYHYVGFEDYTDFDAYIKSLEDSDKGNFWDKNNRRFSSLDEYKKRLFLFEDYYKEGDCSIEEILAYSIVKYLDTGRKLDVKYVSEELKKKLTPALGKNTAYMDHAYFSAIIIFKQMISMFGLDDFPLEFMDAIAAIAMHNKFFELKLKKDGGSLGMEEFPLAYLLILCDELQCWDRASFGKGSIQQLHAIDAKFDFKENGINVEYIFDKRFVNDAFIFDEEGKIIDIVGGTIQKFYYGNKKRVLNKGDKQKEKKLPVIATPSRVKKGEVDTYCIKSSDFMDENTFLYNNESPKQVCKFLGDIADIVEISIDGEGKNDSAIDTSVAARFATRDKYRREYLSETSMRNMYDMAKSVYEKVNNESDFGYEYAPLQKKLMYLSLVRNMSEGLHSIGYFYTNEPKAFEIVEDFSKSYEAEDVEKINKIIEVQKREIDRFCKAHLLEEIADDKLEKIVRECIANLFESRGIEIYKI